MRAKEVAELEERAENAEALLELVKERQLDPSTLETLGHIAGEAYPALVDEWRALIDENAKLRRRNAQWQRDFSIVARALNIGTSPTAPCSFTLAAPERLEAAESALRLLDVSQAERDRAHANGNSLPDKSYPVETRDQLHPAAVLAASKHGD
jgi:hypothetical protein